MSKLALTDSPLDAIVKMADGVPGAVVVLGKLCEGSPLSFMVILDADDMGIRGSAVWDAYKWAGEDVEKLRTALRDRDTSLVAHLKRMGYRVGEHGMS